MGQKNYSPVVQGESFCRPVRTSGPVHTCESRKSDAPLARHSVRSRVPAAVLLVPLADLVAPKPGSYTTADRRCRWGPLACCNFPALSAGAPIERRVAGGGRGRRQMLFWWVAASSSHFGVAGGGGTARARPGR